MKIFETTPSRYLFDFLDTIIAKSGKLLFRNLEVVPGIVGFLHAAAEREPVPV
jgi:hypothetical protein